MGCRSDPFTGRVGSTLNCSYIIVFPKENRASGQTKMDLDRSWCGFSCQFHIGVIINIVFSQITAASIREYIEGITGIIAGSMMLTIGLWLHSKSNVHAWNRYIDKQMNKTIATGSIISFALISFSIHIP